MTHVETAESGADVYQLVSDSRPVDNIYGEQPYSSRDGMRVALRFSGFDGRPGGLSIFDLAEGRAHAVLEREPPFPPFHAWDEYLYYQVERGQERILSRCHYQTLETEELGAVPVMEQGFRWDGTGTVSSDHRYYAVSAHSEGGRSRIVLVDLQENRHTSLAESELYFKHEQFSRDGRNRLLVQANLEPSRAQVRLGVLEVGDGGMHWLAADRPHTPRPTGHEAWVGTSDQVLFSTTPLEGSGENLWVAGAGDSSVRALTGARRHCFNHVSVSRCGRYWVGDEMESPGMAIHAGSMKSGAHRRVLLSHTSPKRWGQLSHTHPYLTSDNHWLIYNSDRSGHPQTYGAKIREGFLQSLHAEDEAG